MQANIPPVSSYFSEPGKEETSLTPTAAAATSSYHLAYPRPLYEDKNSEEEEGAGSDWDSAYGSASSLGYQRPGYTAAGSKVRAVLHKSDLWQLFSSIGNEMIVTKPGR